MVILQNDGEVLYSCPGEVLFRWKTRRMFHMVTVNQSDGVMLYVSFAKRNGDWIGEVKEVRGLMAPIFNSPLNPSVLSLLRNCGDSTIVVDLTDFNVIED